MRNRILIILIFLPLLLAAQVKKKTKTKSHVSSKPAVQDYFTAKGLCIDSAAAPCLYYEVYDWAGTRYKYSGDSKKGIDCSGFVSKMYEDAYCIKLKGGSRDIWSTVQPLEKNELKEGDMLFFKIRKGEISHIGIYLANNKFAHASVKMGVMISDLDEDYYKKRFYKGGRVVMGVDNKQ